MAVSFTVDPEKPAICSRFDDPDIGISVCHLKFTGAAPVFLTEVFMSAYSEVEVKFYLQNLGSFQSLLIEAGGEDYQPRVLEVNLRFDTPDGLLRREQRVLRLRKDFTVYFTYKGAPKPGEEASIREEIEVDVSDFDAAQAFLEALGYQVTLMYEKYRTTYTHQNVLITLDEMPYGYFAEIEGPDPVKIRSASERLGLDWETRSIESYLSLFQRVKDKLNLTFTDLSFENFEGISVAPTDMGIIPGNL